MCDISRVLGSWWAVLILCIWEEEMLPCHCETSAESAVPGSMKLVTYSMRQLML